MFWLVMDSLYSFHFSNINQSEIIRVEISGEVFNRWPVPSVWRQLSTVGQTFVTAMWPTPKPHGNPGEQYPIALIIPNYEREGRRGWKACSPLNSSMKKQQAIFKFIVLIFRER